MKKNLGKLDRIMRVVVSVIIVGMYLKGKTTGTVGLTEVVLAGVFTLTAIVGFCPIYAVLRMNTNEVKE
jgi:hypothetical protein